MIFNVTFDSVTKQATVTADGNPVADLAEFHLYKRWGPDYAGGPFFSMEMCGCTEDESTGVVTMNRVCAAENGTLVADGTEKMTLGHLRREAEAAALHEHALGPKSC